MTIRNARYYHIRRRRVPPAENYSSISENFHTTYVDETEESSIKVAQVYGRVEAGEIAVLPDPRNLEDLLTFERNIHSAAIPDARFGSNFRDPTKRTGS